MRMTEEEFSEPFAAPEIFVDGFSKHTARDGVMTCIGYRNMPEGRMVVVRLVWPAVNTMAAIEEAEAAMAAPVLGVGGSGAKRGFH